MFSNSNQQSNPLANNIRFLTRHIIIELLSNNSVKESEFIKNHIEIIREARKNKRSDGKFETNYNNIDLFLLCGLFNNLNIEKIKKNQKNGAILNKLFEHHLKDLNRLNAVTNLFRKLVLEFLNNDEHFHSVLRAAKRNKEIYPKERYDSVKVQIVDCLKQAAKGIVVTNVQQEKKMAGYQNKEKQQQFIQPKVEQFSSSPESYINNQRCEDRNMQQNQSSMNQQYSQQQNVNRNDLQRTSSGQMNKCLACEEKDLYIRQLQEKQDKLTQQLIELRSKLSWETLENFDSVQSDMNMEQQENNNFFQNFYQNHENIPLSTASEDNNTQDIDQESHETNQNKLLSKQQFKFEDQSSTMMDENQMILKEQEKQIQMLQQQQMVNTQKITVQQDQFNSQQNEQLELLQQIQQQEQQQKQQANSNNVNNATLDLLKQRLQTIEHQPLFSNDIFQQAKMVTQNYNNNNNNNNNTNNDSLFGNKSNNNNNNNMINQYYNVDQEQQMQQQPNSDYNNNNVNQNNNNNGDENMESFLNQQFMDFNNYNNIQINAVQIQQQNNDNNEIQENDSFKTKFGVNLDDKALNQFCKLANNQQEMENNKDFKLTSCLLLQIIMFMNQLQQQNLSNKMFQQFPVFQNIKNITGQLFTKNFVQKDGNNIIQNDQNDQNEVKESVKDIGKNQEKLEKEFQQYKQDFKEEVEKRESIPVQKSNDNQKEQLFKKGIMFRKVGKIFEKMGKINKALENQLKAIQNFVKASGKSYDPTTIYWLYELTQLSVQLQQQQDKEQVYPLVFSHIIVSYQELQKNTKMFKGNRNFQAICEFYLAICAKQLEKNSYALKMFKKCFDMFSDNKEKYKVLLQMADVYYQNKDYKNYYTYSKYALDLCQQVYGRTNPNYIQVVIKYTRMENIVVQEENEEKMSQELLQTIYEKMGNQDKQRTFIQYLIFSDLCLQNKLYENSIEFKKLAIQATQNKLEQASVNQEIGDILSENLKQYLQASKQYDTALSQWNQYFVQQIRILKEKGQDSSYLGKMMELKRGQLRGKQSKIDEILGKMEDSIKKEKQIQNIFISVIGHYDLLGKELIDKIDSKCRDLFLRQRYLENLVHGEDSINFLQCQISKVVKQELQEGIVTIFNRFYMKQIYGCVSQQNMTTLVSFKNFNVDLQKQLLSKNQKQQQQEEKQTLQQQTVQNN